MEAMDQGPNDDFTKLWRFASSRVFRVSQPPQKLHTFVQFRRPRKFFGSQSTGYTNHPQTKKNHSDRLWGFLELPYISWFWGSVFSMSLPRNLSEFSEPASDEFWWWSKSRVVIRPFFYLDTFWRPSLFRKLPCRRQSFLDWQTNEIKNTRQVGKDTGNYASGLQGLFV